MYVCGPTVYNFIHIGNARPCVFFDVVHRFFEFEGLSVTRVMNFTDVDDKIINRARTEKTKCEQITNRYIQEFLTDMQSLGVRPPSHAPKVTEFIPQIIRFIEDLIQQGVAYACPDGEVLYAIRKFPDYGKLSGKRIDDLLVGARVQPGESKRDPLDFSLWKPQKGLDEPAWDSPWGPGRPGWHIECSAMAVNLLGETFDIHGGGMDLIHPHHENEIAQTEGLTNKPFVKYWMHSNMLSFNAEKMSKSLGNIILTRTFVEQNTGEVLKYLLLSSHYRSVIDFSDRHVAECFGALHRVYTTLLKCHKHLKEMKLVEAPAIAEETKAAQFAQQFQTMWVEAMRDDFNTAKALGYVFEYVRLVNAVVDAKKFRASVTTKEVLTRFVEQLSQFSKVFNLFGENCEVYLRNLKKRVIDHRGLTEKEILSAIEARSEARKKKDFALADSIRADLQKKGVLLQDFAAGTEWDVEFHS